MSYILKQLGSIQAFVLDTDGVLTDGGISVTDDGQTLRNYFYRDIEAIRIAVTQGFPVYIIPADGTDILPALLIHAGAQPCSGPDRLPGHVLYMQSGLTSNSGIPASLSCCPSDATDAVKSASAYISPLPGGAGCVHDILEKVLKLQHKWRRPG